jgi:hypothetical protein
MHTAPTPKHSFLAFSLAFLIGASGCSAAQAATAPTQIVTQEVTRLVTQQVTQEVTRVVDVPVTMTPLPTLESDSTPQANATDPSASYPAALPQAVLPQYTDCLYGPATYFSYKTSYPAGHSVEVVGRSEDAAWIEIEEIGDWNSCWIPAGQAQLQSGTVADLPEAPVTLPRSEYEFGSPYTSAKRKGDEVTISWKAVYMSADEIRGYLIDAYVCQGGKFIHLPVFVAKTYKENTGTISVTIIDEAGCAEPSAAHIISVGLRGFAEWEKIFWPPH